MVQEQPIEGPRRTDELKHVALQARTGAQVADLSQMIYDSGGRIPGTGITTRWLPSGWTVVGADKKEATDGIETVRWNGKYWEEKEEDHGGV